MVKLLIGFATGLVFSFVWRRIGDNRYDILGTRMPTWKVLFACCIYVAIKLKIIGVNDDYKIVAYAKRKKN